MTWIPAIGLLTFAALVATMNWAVLFTWIAHRRHSSGMPLVPTVVGAAGCWIAPDGALQPWWWVPALGDIPLLVGIAWAAHERLRRRRYRDDRAD